MTRSILAWAQYIAGNTHAPAHGIVLQRLAPESVDIRRTPVQSARLMLGFGARLMTGPGPVPTPPTHH